MILPGQTFGVLGGGPPGRMLAQAAEALGYRVRVFAAETAASPGDLAALRAFARECAVVACPPEDVPAESLRALAEATCLRPSPGTLDICRDRLHQKHWLRQNKFPHAASAEVIDGDIAAAAARVGRPCIVKTADGGREGRRRMKIANDAEIERAAAVFHGRRCVVERWVDFACELSVVMARTERGEMRAFPVTENIHSRYILDFSIAPARVGAAVAAEAQHLARDLAEKLGVAGLLAVGMFLTDRGELLVNEFTPHPHNSADWTVDGCETSQFEQHVRAVCGLPLGPAGLREPTVTVSILGDGWRDGSEPDWTAVLRDPRTKLRLYAGVEPQPGRKMGYFTVRDPDVESALEAARRLKAELLRRNFS